MEKWPLDEKAEALVKGLARAVRTNERSEVTKAAGRWNPSVFPQGSCSKLVSPLLMTLPRISS